MMMTTTTTTKSLPCEIWVVHGCSVLIPILSANIEVKHQKNQQYASDYWGFESIGPVLDEGRSPFSGRNTILFFLFALLFQGEPIEPTILGTISH